VSKEMPLEDFRAVRIVLEPDDYKSSHKLTECPHGADAHLAGRCQKVRIDRMIARSMMSNEADRKEARKPRAFKPGSGRFRFPETQQE
jgi:hypothetical protein